MAGRVFAGCVNLLLQCTILLWPLAVHWARLFVEQQGTLALLAELSVTYEITSPLPPRLQYYRQFEAWDARPPATFGNGRRRRAAA